MKLTVFAATGGIGRELVAQALNAGHSVTAVARNPAGLDPRARVVRADLATTDHPTLVEAIRGSDAVLSGLGPRHKTDAGIASRGTLAIIRAAKEAGAKKLCIVSAAPVGTVPSPARPHPPKHDPGDNFLVKYLAGPLIKWILHAHYADLAVAEDEVRESGLTWTVVRPPRLTNGPLRKQYRWAYGQNPGGMAISRADVAHAMLKCLGDPAAENQIVGVAD